MKNTAFVCLSLLIFACSAPDSKQIGNKLYFDFPMVVAKQKKILEETNPLVIKKTYINQAFSIDTITVADWQKEFAVFENIDLNKSSYRNKIITKPMYRDTGFINFYYRKKEERIAFKRLISYTTKSNKIKQIWVEIDENTLIYNTRKRIIFDFDTVSNTLKSYQFSGAKGFILMPKDSFFIESTVLEKIK